MDQATLVERQIHDGRKLVEQLVARRFDVDAALWINEQEAGSWYLYLAMPIVDELGTGAAYQAILDALQEIPEMSVDSLRIKAIGSASAIALEVLTTQRQYPTSFPAWRRFPRLGGQSFENAYIYEPVSEMVSTLAAGP